MIHCVICCGGTGGHLAPGIALAQGLRAKGHRVALVVSHKEVDARLLKAYPQLEYVQIPGVLFRATLGGVLRFGISHLRGWVFALRYLRRERPDVLVGFGGFSTVGMALAAFCLHIPIVLHEANRRAGKAVRLFSGLAERVYLPVGMRLRTILPKSVRCYGYPVREEIRCLPKEEARRSLGLHVHGPLLLVLGGSQGASVLNDWAEEHFQELAEKGINLCCITGIGKGRERVLERRNHEGRTMRAYFMPFCDQMAALLSSADLAVARAGAGSIAEFIRCALPSVLVPYPHAAGGHQLENAAFLERQGGAVLLPQKELGSLNREVLDAIFNEHLLAGMRRNLQLLERGNCLDLIIQDIEHIVGLRVEPKSSASTSSQLL